ncbi:MAG TPA: NCS2 family permease [Intrasporangium sp.]|uniref:NCS2 family permease n=1 Tax=Intrasporangium sp. TaxID=1925024 RepID=UPI002D797ADF|nr:NCS2 family permease [Intrasporangium sp.]HET7398782.1 NCS2 family permease [Intrasporangium sp.]
MSTPSSTTTRPASTGLDRFFRISERGSTVAREVRGGVVTFFTMVYIVVLNPIILSGIKDGSGTFIGGVTDLNESKLLVAVGTAVIAGVMSILMGVVANFPIALAAGLGINGLIASMVLTHATAERITFADLMGLVVIEGLIITVLVMTGFRKAVFRAIPPPLKVAISVGIGLFIAFIGVIDAGFARRPSSPGSVPSELGIGGNLNGWPTLVFVVGVFLIAVLLIRRVKGAILIGIAAATALAMVLEAVFQIGPRVYTDKGLQNPEAWSLTVPKLPDSITNTPDLGILGQFSLLGSFGKLGLVTAVMFVFSLLLADFFDTMGTIVAIGGEAGLLDQEGNPPNTERILIVDSLAAVAGGAGGVSSNTSYIESASGVGEGARTGLASIVTGVLFLLATFLAPLFAIVPSEAAAPALVIVGFLMMQQVTNVDWSDLEVGIPAFLTIILMPFTYNITVGIGAGFIAWVLVRIAKGHAARIHPLLWAVSGLFVVYFVKAPLEQLLTR